MTERTFRIFLGAGLFILLYISAIIDRTDLILFYIGLLVFEGVTNWRLPRLLTHIKHKISSVESEMDEHPLPHEMSRHITIPFEAERAMRTCKRSPKRATSGDSTVR